MGFLDGLGKLAGAAMNEIKEAGERSKVYKQEMLDKSDYELARIFKRDNSLSPIRAGAALQELKSRGYNQDEIKEMVRNA
ncbi:hypothetical protein BKK51_10870 [Rodentibacter trehalosifermentans]|uniref:Regulatory protein RecX n=2 Tax=Rodentibacter TaxID=1960084 RepID=A0A1V3IK00_9PAST|nr:MULTISPECIES: hypothetical protein [Rodentibacter]OOF41497.1 hypothetical protein BKK50_08430 [Rodentibacter rarus]OOF43812.1 hypothetical protein BKK51_10870 [Rodentibacter trehalosifermentans]OOF45136.1 hypothetical protein BKK52_12860 [Rodentibacter trehalosifermentans]